MIQLRAPGQFLLIASTLLLILARADFSLAEPSKPTPHPASSITPKLAIDRRLIGTWEVVLLDQQKSRYPTGITITFAQNGKLYLLLESGGAQEFWYRNASHRQPKQLDVSYDGSYDSQETYYLIYEFISDSQLRLDGDYVGQPRPTAIASEVSKSFELKRISDGMSPRLMTLLRSPREKLIPAVEAQTKQFARLITEAQQAYFLKNIQFAESLQALNLLSNPLRTQAYAYKITSIDPKRIVQNVAIARMEGLKSYAGFVYLLSTSSSITTISLVCESNQPTQQPPGKPTIEGEVIQCPIGYSPVDVPTKATREFNEGFSVRD